jgi:chromosome segregation ATPase
MERVLEHIADLRERMRAAEVTRDHVQDRLATGETRMSNQDDRSERIEGGLWNLHSLYQDHERRLADLPAMRSRLRRAEAKIDRADGRRQAIGRFAAWAAIISAPLLALAGKISWPAALGVLRWASGIG